VYLSFNQLYLVSYSRHIFMLIFVAGIPKLHWYGSEGEYNIVAMDFLGSNLEELLKDAGGKFSMITCLFIAD
jgi:hypothetical protein